MQHDYDDDGGLSELEKRSGPIDTGTGNGAALDTTATAPPAGHELVNPFARYGALEGSTSFFNGDFIKLDQKLGYVRGQEKDPADTAQGWVTNMMEARHGYIRYPRSEGDKVEHDVYLICEHPEPPLCRACGYSMREHDEQPKRCEMKPVVYLPLRPLGDPDDVVCFSGNGRGARVAVAELCKIYGRPGADRGGRDFCVMLETRSFGNSEGGTTVWPVFRPIGYEFFVPDTPAPTPQPIAVSTAAAGKALPGRKGRDDPYAL